MIAGALHGHTCCGHNHFIHAAILEEITQLPLDSGLGITIHFSQTN
jgi:hypothetical protein